MICYSTIIGSASLSLQSATFETPVSLHLVNVIAPPKTAFVDSKLTSLRNNLAFILSNFLYPSDQPHLVKNGFYFGRYSSQFDGRS
ncbi:hypothetical protein SAMN05421761_1301 [Belliella pelovolcani]|uniref:Uncharacterized protein n=1 Tax=Belliella pelovolcani TaxID=529505 RepID=A0A1N7Q4J9_9BACT|nr:hypothetical protein SAMN05421761_1301 [Belliella pelovolcani]